MDYNKILIDKNFNHCNSNQLFKINNKFIKNQVKKI
jgi:hypothetical protein